MGEIHIFTGGKGGVGKTMFSLCSMLFYRKRTKKILLLDLNFNNPNIIHMFHSFSGKEGSPFGANEIQMRVLEFDPSFYMAYSAKLHILPTGIIDIYKYINAAYTFLREKNFEPDIIIVDTNLSLANFWTDSAETFNTIKSFMQETVVKNFIPFFWHIWTLSDLIYVQKIEGKIVGQSGSFPIISAALEEIKMVWGDKFNETRNLINVFNVYALYPYGNMAQPLRNQLFFWGTELDKGKINELSFIEKRKFSPLGMSLNQMYDIINKYQEIQDDDLAELSDKAQEMYEALGEAITKVMTKQFNGEIPKNLLTIGTYRPQLVGFTDLWAAKIKSIEDIEDILSPLFKLITIYLSNLARELDNEK